MTTRHKIFYILFITCLFIFTLTSQVLADESGRGIFHDVSESCWERGDCGVCDFIVTFTYMQKYVLGGLGALVLLFFIYGGIRLTISHGNSEEIRASQQVLINTAIGVILILVAWTIVNFVILAMSGQGGEIGLIFDSKEWYKACVSQ